MGQGFYGILAVDVGHSSVFIVRIELKLGTHGSYVSVEAPK